MRKDIDYRPEMGDVFWFAPLLAVPIYFGKPTDGECPMDIAYFCTRDEWLAQLIGAKHESE